MPSAMPTGPGTRIVIVFDETLKRRRDRRRGGVAVCVARAEDMIGRDAGGLGCGLFWGSVVNPREGPMQLVAGDQRNPSFAVVGTRQRVAQPIIGLGRPCGASLLPEELTGIFPGDVDRKGTGRGRRDQSSRRLTIDSVWIPKRISEKTRAARIAPVRAETSLKCE